jgi:predicted sulfurtransferase
MTKTWRVLLTIASLAVTIVFLVVANREIPIREVTREDAIAEAAAGGYRLIDLEGMRALCEDRSTALLLVDTRQEWEYQGGCIEGAVLFEIEPTRWSRFSKRGELAELLGPDRDRAIVFY